MTGSSSGWKWRVTTKPPSGARNKRELYNTCYSCQQRATSAQTIAIVHKYRSTEELLHALCDRSYLPALRLAAQQRTCLQQHLPSERKSSDAGLVCSREGGAKGKPTTLQNLTGALAVGGELDAAAMYEWVTALLHSAYRFSGARKAKG